MEKSWFLAFLLLLQIIATKASYGLGDGFVVGGGVGVVVGKGNAGGGGGVQIRGGINSPSPSGSSVSNVDIAYTALQAWKLAITDDPMKILDTWVGTNVCSYTGVFCGDSQDGKYGAPSGPVVRAIDLNRANLQGSLVKELSVLTDMSLLHLNSNRFSGTVPDTFKDLISLQELDLSNNQFSGTFPTVTLDIPNLIYLDLRFNSFSGPITEDIFNRKLDAIFLNNNQFEGEIPQNLGNSPASVMNFANNKLSGEIPASFSMMSYKVKEVLFINNQLTGCIPQGIGLFSDVQVLDLSFNSLTGHVPETVACLEKIEVLNLGHNKLSGELADSICSLKSLLNLTVAYNFFSGFSEDCSELFFRNVGVDVSENCIPGRGMQRPQPECSGIPGGSLSCLRIPAAPRLACGTLADISVANSSSLSSSSP